jgi:YfiH family protein
MVVGSIGRRVRYAFTTRDGGVSQPPYASLNLSAQVGDDAGAVSANRERVRARLGVPAIVWQRAEHGGRVCVVDALRDRAAEPSADGLIVLAPGCAVAALAADCVLFVLADRMGRAVGVGHCGWRGLLAGIVGAVVDGVRAAAGDGAPLHAVLGPAICGSCYAVGPEVYEAVTGTVPAAAAHTPSGQWALDVAAGVAAQLRDHGVVIDNRIGGCTYEDAAFFSYRRDGVTGRHAVLAWLEP